MSPLAITLQGIRFLKLNQTPSTKIQKLPHDLRCSCRLFPPHIPKIQLAPLISTSKLGRLRALRDGVVLYIKYCRIDFQGKASCRPLRGELIKAVGCHTRVLNRVFRVLRVWWG